MEYKEIQTYLDADSFIEAHKGLWDMLESKYEKIDEENIENYFWYKVIMKRL